MWYNNLSEYFLKEWFKNDPFVLQKIIFSIIFVYVNDMDIIGTLEEPLKTIYCLKKWFEMNDLGMTKFCLGLQIKYLNNKFFVYQEAYKKKG